MTAAGLAVLLPDGQGLRDGATGEDPVGAQEQDHGLARPLHHTLEQALHTDHAQAPTSVSNH